MKLRRFIVLIFILVVIKNISAQDSIKSKVPFFIPQKTSFCINSNFHWFISDGINSDFTDQMYVRANLKYTPNIELVIINKTKLENDTLLNRFSDLYFEYRKYFKANAKIPIFKYGSFLNIKLGMLEWYPLYTNTQLILENAEKFMNPPQIFGGSINSVVPLTRDRSLKTNLAAHTGDLINKKLEPELLDFNVNYTKIFKYNFGISAQVGIAQGSRHFVNYAHLLYQPKLENVQFDFKIGKLLAYDVTPYGIHLGINRKFKYISLGGYYEKRLNQSTKGEIAGINWCVIGPPKLAKFMSAFNCFYDFNTNTIWMWIPILKIDIQHK
jgi:hypothetical protein